MTLARVLLSRNHFGRYESNGITRCIATLDRHTKNELVPSIRINDHCVPLKSSAMARGNFKISSKRPMLQTKREFWGFFNKTNRLTEALLTDNGEAIKQYIDYTDLQPDHIRQTADQLKVKYELDLEILDGSLNSDASYEDVIPELERISRPLTILQNIITLLSCVKKDPAMSDALHEANEKIKIKHGFPTSITHVLVRIEEQLNESETNEENERVITGLLRKQRLNGFMGNDDEIQQQVQGIQEQLEQTQAKFLDRSSLTMEEHGTEATPQELIPMMYEIVALQQHLSKLLGYQSYAEYCLEYHNSMAKGVEEIEAIHKLFEQQGAVEKFSSDDFQSTYLDLVGNPETVDLKDYLEFNTVLNGLFSFCQTLFGVVIEQEKNNANVNGWHPDVRLFHVFEEGDTKSDPIASFYLDPYRRQYKDLGCFMTPIQYQNDECIPIVAISMDIRPPMWDDDASIELELQNVVNLYHEFGHALQQMLADVKLGEFSGAQIMEEDSSETVSQFMEYWLFEGDGLSKLCKHKQTGESISEEVMDKIKMQRKATKANELLHRLFLGSLELELNSKFDPHGDESIIALQRNNAMRYSPHFLPPKGNIDTLIQIFQNDAVGKRTMQYRYLWSEITSADAFAAFINENGHVKDEQELKEVGKQMRDEFFGAGASKSAANSFASFRGRNAEIVALLSNYDLLK